MIALVAMSASRRTQINCTWQAGQANNFKCSTCILSPPIYSPAVSLHGPDQHEQPMCASESAQQSPCLISIKKDLRIRVTSKRVPETLQLSSQLREVGLPRYTQLAAPNVIGCAPRCSTGR